MRIAAACALLVLGLKPLRAQETAYAELDARLEKAGGLLSALERCAVPGTESGIAEVCAAELTAEQVLQRKELTRWDSAVPYAGEKYHLCLAVAKREPAACDGLARVAIIGCPDAPFHSAAEFCRNAYGRVMLSKALISRDPAARELCLKAGPDMGERELPRDQKEGKCAVLLDGGAGPEPACAKAAGRRFVLGSDSKDCEKGVRDYWGLSPRCDVPAIAQKQSETIEPDPKALRLIGGPHEMLSCAASNAAAGFRTAFAARDPEACGPDPLCLAMMTGETAACGAYSSEILEAKRRMCAAPDSWGASRDELAACASVEKDGGAAFDSLRAALDAVDPKGSQGLRRRVSRYAALKKRWDQGLEKRQALKP